jgi:hypothetical protein
MFLPIAAGKYSSGYLTAAGHCYKDTGKPLGNAHRLLDSLCAILKGIVQRKLTGVETRLKRCALVNCLVGNVYFF